MNLKQIFHTFFVNKQIVVIQKPIEEFEQEIIHLIQQNASDISSLIILEQIQNHYNQNHMSALSTIKMGLQIDQQNIDLRLDLIEILISYKKGSIEEILNLLDECYIIDSAYWRCDFLKSYLGAYLNNDKLHRQSLEVALKKSPNNPWIKATLALYFGEIVTLQPKARELLESIENQQLEKEHQNEFYQSQYEMLSPKFFNYDLIRKMAVTHYLLGNYKISEDYFKKSYDMNPKSFRLLTNIAQFERLHNKNYHRSIELCKQALSIEPNYHLALFNCAVSYDKLGAAEQFLDTIQKSLNQKKSKQNYQQIAYYYWRKGDQNKSVYYSKKLISQYKQYVYPYYIYIQSQVNKAPDLEEYEMVIQSYFNLVLTQFENIYLSQFISNQTLFIYS